MELRRHLCLFAVLGSLLVLLGATDFRGTSVANATPPNVVMILADDVGWTDWQYDAVRNPTGSLVYETPNILQLSQRSVNFTNAYAACPVCSPSRASILTGKSPARTRITNFLPGNPNTSATLREPFGWQTILPGPGTQPNFVNTLKANGYSTGLFGKWHLGTASPTIYGFDTNVGGSSAGGPAESGGWFAGADGNWGLPGLDTPGQYPADKYLSDAVTEQAGNFIQQHASQPFVLADWDFQSHIPLQAPQALIDKYQTKINTLTGQGVNLKGHTNATYAAMIEKLDQDVGAIVGRLDDPNNDGNKSDSVLNNTIFIFTSDNGGDYDADGNPTRNLPLREGKGSMYEGGIRVPLMVSWPNDPNISPGTTSTARTSLYDLYPTIFDMTGLTAAMPQNNPIDGVSIRTAIEGGAFDRGLLYWHYPHRSNQDLSSPLINGGSFVSAVSNKDWKLLFFYEDRHYELYNITSDIGETTNLLAYNPTIAHDLSLALQNYLVGVAAQMPVTIATGLPVAVPPVLSAPLAGDYNNDAVVNAADYTQWRSDFGSTTHLQADGNGNGTVDIADYVFWRNIMSGAGAAVGAGLAAVPEPGTMTLFALGCFLASAAYPTRFRRRQ